MQLYSSKGVATGSVTGESSAAMLDSVYRAEHQLLFFTPEMILRKKWRKLLQRDDYRQRVKGMIIDEAHTVKKW